MKYYADFETNPPKFNNCLTTEDGDVIIFKSRKDLALWCYKVFYQSHLNVILEKTLEIRNVKLEFVGNPFIEARSGCLMTLCKKSLYKIQSEPLGSLYSDCEAMWTRAMKL